MSKILKIYKDNWPIITILFIALLIRLVGINYGLPNFFIGDEQALIGGSLKMIELKTLIPSLYPQDFRLLYYPPLISYLYLLFFTPIVLFKYLLIGNLDLLKINFILDPGIFILAARFLSVLFSVATIYIIYLLGKKIFNKKVAIFTCLFLTFSFLHLQLSHAARHWTYDLFFTYFVILLSFYLPKIKIYFFIGLLGGLAFGSSYLPAISFIIPLIIHFIQPLPLGKKIKDKNLWLMIFTFLITVFLFISLHSTAFFRIFVGEKSGLILKKSILDYFLSFPYYFSILLKLETVLLITSFFGLIVLFFKNKKIFYISSFFIFLYISVLYLFFHHEPRYIIIILPLLCLFSGFALDFITEKLSRKYYFLVVILFFLYPFILDVKYDTLLLKKDNRVLAKEWIENNLNPKSKIASYWESIKLIPSKEAIKEQQKIDPQSLRNLEENLLNLNEKFYPSPNFYVLPLHFIQIEKIPDLKAYLKENNYEYLLIDYLKDSEIDGRQKEIIINSELIKKFGDSNPMDLNGNFSEFLFNILSLKRLGPTVEIYRINL